MSELWSRRGGANFVGSLPSPTDETRLEPSSPGANMLRSPDRRSPSCTRGKTMREFEEELNGLKRENFDLKMRIYVLNEYLEVIQSVDNIEEICEAHTKLKKEIQNLKAELADKEDLILKTGEAMNLLSNKHREEITLLKAKSQEEAEQYQDIIGRLKQELMCTNKSMMISNRPEFDDSTAVYAMAFGLNENNYNESVSQDLETKEQVLRLETELATKNKQMEEANAKIKFLEDQICTLQDEASTIRKDLKNKSEKLDEVFNDLRHREIQADDLHKKIFTLESSLQDKEAEFEEMSKKFASIKEVKDTFDICKKQLDRTKSENESLKNQLTQAHKKINRKSMQECRDPAISVKSIQPKTCKSCSDKSKLEEKLASLESSLVEKESELEEVKVENRKMLKSLQTFIKHNKALNKDVENLKVQLKNEEEGKHETSPSEVNLMADSSDVDKKELIKDLENKIQILTDSLKEKDFKLKELNERTGEGEKEERVEELELLVSTLKSQLDTILTKECKENDELSTLKAEIESKNKTVEQLNEELRKRTFNLQELVNTELWDKNREIEKLNKQCEKKQNESMELRAKMESQQNELIALNDKIQELSDNINCKLTKKDVERLVEQLESEKEKNKRLTEKCDDFEREMNKSEKARKELVNACLLLQTRLEELVFFMDSLIPSLTDKNKQILQEAVDRSREALSVLEETTIHTPTPILPDFSQVDFFHDSFNLDPKTLGKENLVRQNFEVSNMKMQLDSAVERRLSEDRLNNKSSLFSKLNEKDQMALKELNDMAQSFVLDEITEGSVPEFPTDSEPQRDPRAGNSPPKTAQKEIADVSDSEEWSEPDRTVSQARIGITNESVIKAPVESTDISEHSDKQNPSKRRYKFNDVRKLNLKVKQLGNVVETLRLSPSKCQSDSNFTIQINDQASTAAILDKIMEGRKFIDDTLKQSESLVNHINHLAMEEHGKTGLLNQITNISDNLTSLTILCQEMEHFLIQAESDKKDICLKMFDNDRKIDYLNNLILRQQSELKEKENEVLEKQCALLELKNQYLISESKSKNVENRLAEANMKLQEYLKNAEKEKFVSKELHAQEICNLQQKLKQKQEEINQIKVKLEKANESIERLNLVNMHSEEEHKQQLDMLMQESQEKIDHEVNMRMEVEKKLTISFQMQADLRNQLENEITNSRTIVTTQKKMESWWRKKFYELETTSLERESDLRRRLDAVTLTTSQAVLERTKLANTKIQLQTELRRLEDNVKKVKEELEQRISILEKVNNELQKKLSCHQMPRSEPGSPTHNFNRHRSNPTSDYTSDPDHGSSNNLWFGRNNNCSPDLGIDSDPGRLSSLDTNSSPKAHGCCEQLMLENKSLRGELEQTKSALSRSLFLYNESKKRMKHFDKAISQEIDKTNDVLSQTRLNLIAPKPSQQ